MDRATPTVGSLNKKGREMSISFTSIRDAFNELLLRRKRRWL
jgi:hypothetical protein